MCPCQIAHDCLNLPTCAPPGLEPPTYHILGRQHCSVHHDLKNSATKAGYEVLRISVYISINKLKWSDKYRLIVENIK